MAGLVNLDIGGIFNPIADIAKKAILDPTKVKELEAAVQTAMLNLQKGQMEVNAVEAAHTSIFVAGWRPFVGWVCGVALAYTVIVVPVLSNWFTLAPVEMELLEKILMGMLGLSVGRSVEKVIGVARGAIGRPKKKRGGFFKNLFRKKNKEN